MEAINQASFVLPRDFAKSVLHRQYVNVEERCGASGAVQVQCREFLKGLNILNNPLIFGRRARHIKSLLSSDPGRGRVWR